jgi:dipeptidyl aminopeptidase/acylaminoacyl peptidase
LIPCTHLFVLLRPLPGGKELLWYSERSGFAHLYLYDLETGALKNAITQGDWVLRNILHFDSDTRELTIQTAGRVAGRNPYFRDICRVNIDSGEMVTVLSSDHDYLVCDTTARECGNGKNLESNSHKQGVSPNGRYWVATRSRADELPVSVLYDDKGNILLELELADVSGLPEGWRWPEHVTVKATDGETDLEGLIYRPSHFSEDKSYPVLDFSSYGDYIPASSFSNAISGGWCYFPPIAYAELGFIVVSIRSRGTGLRSRHFRTDKITPMFHCYHQDDCVEGIKQLAKQRPYMDISRVGAGGYGSPPYVLNGLLLYPDFYTAGVNYNAFIDMRITAEMVIESSSDGRFDGEAFKKFHCLEDYAENLKGKLMLCHGMLDTTTPAAATLRMVEKLQLLNKEFDMLLMPNGIHGSGRYVTLRTWNYFVRHLKGLEPPIEFPLSKKLDLVDTTLELYKVFYGDEF